MGKSTCLGFATVYSDLFTLTLTKGGELKSHEKGITMGGKEIEKNLNANVMEIYYDKDGKKVWKFKLNGKDIFVDEEYRKNNTIPNFKWHTAIKENIWFVYNDTEYCAICSDKSIKLVATEKCEKTGETEKSKSFNWECGVNSNSKCTLILSTEACNTNDRGWSTTPVPFF